VPLDDIAKNRLLEIVTDARLRSGFTWRQTKLESLRLAEDQERAYLESINTLTGYEKLLCAMMYWCEGAKADNIVKFTNSDPMLIKRFLSLFRNSFSLDESKFRVVLHLHDYHDEQMQMQFWSEVTNIPQLQFYRPYRKPHTSLRKRPDYPGCACINYNDVFVARRLLTLAKLYLAI